MHRYTRIICYFNGGGEHELHRSIWTKSRWWTKEVCFCYAHALWDHKFQHWSILIQKQWGLHFVWASIHQDTAHNHTLSLFLFVSLKTSYYYIDSHPYIHKCNMIFQPWLYERNFCIDLKSKSFSSCGFFVSLAIRLYSVFLLVVYLIFCFQKRRSMKQKSVK